MNQRRTLKGDPEFGNGPASQRHIDRFVAETDGDEAVPNRTSEPPSQPRIGQNDVSQRAERRARPSELLTTLRDRPPIKHSEPVTPISKR